MQESDAALVARAQQGDEAAFEQLVRRHQRYAFNVAYRVLGDYAEAEDMTQEAFVRAWRGLRTFRGQAKFTTWLYRIVHNLCLNRLPHLRRELVQSEPLEEVLPNPVAPLPERFEAQERVAFLHAQVTQLPEKYRLVLTLRYLQDLSYQEIAAVLDVPMGTVKTHIHRARRLLIERQRRWEECGAQPGQARAAQDDNSPDNAALGFALPRLQEAGG